MQEGSVLGTALGGPFVPVLGGSSQGVGAMALGGGERPGPLGRWRLPTRASRVSWLVIAVLLMSLADLDITMVYVRSVGLAESNPVARYVMEWNQPWLLVLWKVASIGFSCTVLWMARRLAAAEIAAWVCCLALAWLTLQWIDYTAEAHVLTPALHSLADAETARWVQMDR